MKKKNIFTILALVVLIVLVVFLVFFQDKKLEITSKKVADLYKSLGEADINKCGGLITYSDKAMTESDLDIENRLCQAYYNLSDSQKEVQTIKSDGHNDSNIKTCKVGENTTLATTDEEESECTYQEIEKASLKEKYKEIYGNEMTEQDRFYISDKNICIKEGEKYFCGEAESYKMSITPETTIYRIIDKAVQKLNGEIIICDYFLKISNNVCYSGNNTIENKECSDAIKNKDLNNDNEAISIVKKYGTIYKHTFKEDSNKNYYWYKSELKLK